MHEILTFWCLVNFFFKRLDVMQDNDQLISNNLYQIYFKLLHAQDWCWKFYVWSVLLASFEVICMVSVIGFIWGYMYGQCYWLHLKLYVWSVLLASFEVICMVSVIGFIWSYMYGQCYWLHLKLYEVCVAIIVEPVFRGHSDERTPCFTVPCVIRYIMFKCVDYVLQTEDSAQYRGGLESSDTRRTHFSPGGV